MITDTDTKKLLKAFKEVFSTKEDLKDLRSQMSDDIDGKLKIQKREILAEMYTKFAKQKEEVVKGVGKYVADIIVPMFDERDKHIARIQKKLNLPPLAD